MVVVVSEGGKERSLEQRGNEIETFLKTGFAVCLADVRGTGETAPDTRRGPSSAEVSLSATELMLGDTLLGARFERCADGLSLPFGPTGYFVQPPSGSPKCA